MPESSPPVVNYTARTFESIRAELTAFIEATRPDDFTDFTQSNLGVMLLELMAYVGDNLSYGQDITAQEVFLSTARRFDSALRAARSVGAPVRGATGAQVTVGSETLPQNIVTFGATIAAGQFITGANGLRYELLANTTIIPGSSSVTLVLRQGESLSDTFTPTKTPRQEFRTTQGIVEEGSWDVYVGDVNDPTNLWTQVSNVAFETTPTETYEVFFDGAGRLNVRFGDGTAGKIPDQDITIRYRITDGARGNAAANTIRGSVQAQVIGQGLTASITLVNDESAAAGGQDRDNVATLRRSIPAFIRTLDKVITIQDYNDAVGTQIPGVALAFADVPLSALNGNVVRVHAWASEAFTFVSTSPGQGFTSAVTYDRYAVAPTSTAYTVQQYLLPRTISTVHNVVIRPGIATVFLDLGQVRYDTRNAAATVHKGIVQAVVSTFEESSGFLVRLSDIYDNVLAVPGVIGFSIQRITFTHIDFTGATTNTVVDEYRRDQDVSGAQGGPFQPLQDIEVPAATQRAFYDDTFLFDNEILYDSEIDATVIQAINLNSLSFTLIAGK